MLIGYARGSSENQDLALQETALKNSGCETIYTDCVNGTNAERPALEQALTQLRDDKDVLVVWRLDRLGGPLKHLISLITELEERDIGFRSLQDDIDTTAGGGKSTFRLFRALAEFEHNLIRERTEAGLAAARARGKKGGRRKALDDEKTQRLYHLYDETEPGGTKKYTIREICSMMGISKSTLYTYLGQRNGTVPA